MILHHSFILLFLCLYIFYYNKYMFVLLISHILLVFLFRVWNLDLNLSRMETHPSKVQGYHHLEEGFVFLQGHTLNVAGDA